MTATKLTNFISEALCVPTNALTYEVSRKLAELYPQKSILEGNEIAFAFHLYAQAGNCQRVANPAIHNQFKIFFDDGNLQILADKVWWLVNWQSENLEVIWFMIEGNLYYWILADNEKVATAFFQAVCDWDGDISGQILIYNDGYWEKDRQLFQDIKNTTFDNLVLPARLKQEIQADAQLFFNSQAVYDRYQIPWKRGILFIGPPGNGKTHAVKALINSLNKPCLYVKSFRSVYATDNGNIAKVFDKARELNPAIIVLEDLDSLIDSQNRAFFLNELDGFAANQGILTLATTNYPERLDPAIINRPSRFDRKYHFLLPSLAERQDYINLWNTTLQTALKLPEAEINTLAAQTEGFSFAYIKELFLSAMMHWIDQHGETSMAAVMLSQVVLLREQMSSINS